ncbi:MAG: NAD(P)/FAD-dependent oxidoreductase [Planctomycetales bacterium]|nr:NAD(P)/FAD-dependent oxidoreductase [bacterium]UNM09077.1 MAG: NAD(P)/FAD-dependent oxidoreductase [Planctomycetales bacterium]
MGLPDAQIVIAGGGPAGSMSAGLLARAGFDVLLLESGGPDNDVLCSGLLNPEAQAALGVSPPAHVLRDPLAPLLQYHDRDNCVRLEYDPRYVNTSRPAFDAWLREEAQAQGVKIHYETRAKRISHDERGISLATSAGELSCRVLLDCTGWRALSRKQSERRPAPAVHAFQGTITADLPPGSMWAIFDSALTDYYAWIVPKGGQRFLLGAGYLQASEVTRDQADNPWGKLTRMLDYLDALGCSVELEDAKPLGSPITTPTDMRQLWWGERGVVPVGEASGMVSPSSGDGISFCLQGGISIAQTLTQFRSELSSPVSEDLHRRILRRYLAGMAPALSELRFNILKARTAADPLWRNAAVRLLPLFLRRPVQHLDWAAGHARSA